MREPIRNTVKLPRQLLEESGISGDGYGGAKKERRPPIHRKELRKAARVQKKSSHIQKSKAKSMAQRSSNSCRLTSSNDSSIHSQSNAAASPVAPRTVSSILKVVETRPMKSEERDRTFKVSPSLSPPPKVSRGMRDKFAGDDAEIAALEKALGVTGKKKLPKAFEEDGLDSLLEGIGVAEDLNGGRAGKRKRSEAVEWLERKRQKAQGDVEAAENLDNSEASEDENAFSDSESEEFSEDGKGLDNMDNGDSYGSDTSVDEQDQALPKSATSRTRENPYVAPKVHSRVVEPGKYVPPSIRKRDLEVTEDLSQLRRQIQGLLNRLSEANIIAILGDVEKLYQNNPRQHVTATLLDLLMELLCDPSQLQDTFIILHAGFIAALYKVIGTDFGAQAIHRVYKNFDQNYRAGRIEDETGKKLVNLMALLSVLYNFQVIGSNLVYDYVRLCLNDLSKTNTELLLKIIRSAGQQLRQDDPSSLKDIIVQIQAAMAKTGEENLSVRTKFMVETINDLKNNRMKTGVAAATISSEHMIRMKKTLGFLNTRSLKAIEPLRVGIKDLRGRDKVGTWWLVGANYKGGVPEDEEPSPRRQASRSGRPEEVHQDSVAADLVRLAKEQRMNTDVRRSVFISIMSSTDYNDAYARLMKLHLKRAQETEIPKVLIHCAGAEKVYNPFYTFLSRRVCSAKKLKMSFQFSLWDLFKEMGEGDDDRDGGQDEDDQGTARLGLRSLVNLAKMFGVLIAEGGLSLDVLKPLNFAYLQPKTKTFVEILLITAILQSQQGFDSHHNDKALLGIFLKPKHISRMAGGLRFFLKTVVTRTDVAGSRTEKEIIKWGCRSAGDALKVVAI